MTFALQKKMEGGRGTQTKHKRKTVGKKQGKGKENKDWMQDGEKFKLASDFEIRTKFLSTIKNNYNDTILVNHVTESFINDEFLKSQSSPYKLIQPPVPSTWVERLRSSTSFPIRRCLEQKKI